MVTIIALCFQFSVAAMSLPISSSLNTDIPLQNWWKKAPTRYLIRFIPCDDRIAAVWMLLTSVNAIESSAQASLF